MIYRQSNLTPAVALAFGRKINSLTLKTPADRAGSLADEKPTPTFGKRTP
jgi:hypothetical protein